VSVWQKRVLVMMPMLAIGAYLGLPWWAVVSVLVLVLIADKIG
jgi:hypothetical protein